MKTMLEGHPTYSWTGPDAWKDRELGKSHACMSSMMTIIYIPIHIL